MAINTSRAPRKTHIPSSGVTAEGVGPGTYSNTHNEPNPPPGEVAVPFGTTEQRALNSNLGTSALTPGPGAYLGSKVVSKTGTKDYGEDTPGAGHCGIRSRSKRMGPSAPGSSVYSSSTIEKNPGPGTYPKAIHQDLGKAVAKNCQPAMRPVLEVTDKTTPSMPRMRLLPGQRPDVEAGADEAVHLHVRHTGDGGDTAGPGEYDPRGEQIVLRTVPATVFHTSTLSRKLWEPSGAIENKMAPKENPGPGTYDKDDKTKEEEDVLPSFQFSSRAKMAHQQEPNAEKLLPGPGQYDQQADIDKTVRTARDRSAARGDMTQFGSMTERTCMLNRDANQPYKDPYHCRNVPGPGHYTHVTSTFMEDPKAKEAEKAIPDWRKKKIHGVHHPTIVMALADAQGPLQAFNTSDDRHCNKFSDQRTPAPWQYNKDTARGFSMSADLKERVKVGRRGAFGTCADRFYGSPLAGRQGLPDPTTDGSEGIHTSANVEPRSSFQSAAPRFHSAPGPREDLATKVGVTDTPAPGAYDTMKEPNYTSQDRHPRREHLSFGSGRTRFDDAKPSEDVFFGHRQFASNPGPGEYQPQSARERVVGASRVTGCRPNNLVGATAEGVGPGSYGETNTHMLKKTFNISTQAPVSSDVSSMSKKPMSGMLGM